MIEKLDSLTSEDRAILVGGLVLELQTCIHEAKRKEGDAGWTLNEHQRVAYWMARTERVCDLLAQLRGMPSREG